MSERIAHPRRPRHRPGVRPRRRRRRPDRRRRVAAVGPNVAADGAASSTRAGSSSRRASSTSTRTCATPASSTRKTSQSGTRAAARGGFTTVCAMPNTEPADGHALRRRVRAARGRRARPRARPADRRRHARAAPARSLPSWATSPRPGCVAFSDDGAPVADATLMRRALEYASAFGLPIIDHCEDPSLARDAVMHEGWVSTRLGLRGAPAAAEEAAVARDIALAEATGAHVHIAHVSTRRRRRGDPPREGARRARHGGGDAAPPDAHATRSSRSARWAATTWSTTRTRRSTRRCARRDDVAACVAGLADGDDRLHRDRPRAARRSSRSCASSTTPRSASAASRRRSASA